MKPRILVIDDDAEIRKSFKMTLEYAGNDVILAATGEEGVKLVHRQLEQMLEREGLAPVATDGKFDPHVHEALLTQPSASEEGSVIEVLQKGYRLGDRVLRPARVVVAGPKEEPSGDES